MFDYRNIGVSYLNPLMYTIVDNNGKYLFMDSFRNYIFMAHMKFKRKYLHYADVSNVNFQCTYLNFFI